MLSDPNPPLASMQAGEYIFSSWARNVSMYVDMFEWGKTIHWSLSIFIHLFIIFIPLLGVRVHPFFPSFLASHPRVSSRGGAVLFLFIFLFIFFVQFFLFFACWTQSPELWVLAPDKATASHTLPACPRARDIPQKIAERQVRFFAHVYVGMYVSVSRVRCFFVIAQLCGWLRWGAGASVTVFFLFFFL